MKKKTIKVEKTIQKALFVLMCFPVIARLTNFIGIERIKMKAIHDKALIVKILIDFKNFLLYVPMACSFC
ncbi:MAG TPA: hypothetical protein DDY44_03495 [Candidatus Moranbacteria bacterium]|nr:hypothetical protein [Candidatus Moranbacteria bacterium]